MEETTEPKKEEYSKSYRARPMWQWIVIYLIIGGLIYGAIYYFMYAGKGYKMESATNESMNKMGEPTVVPTDSKSSDQSVMTEEAQKLTVVGNEFQFIPKTVTVGEGRPVALTFKNHGKFPHNLTIAGLSVATKTIEPGEEDTVTFTPDKKGSFEFDCTVGNHKDKGMVGTLVVE